MAKFSDVEVLFVGESQDLQRLLALCYSTAWAAGVDRDMLRLFLREFNLQDSYLDALEVCRRWFRIRL